MLGAALLADPVILGEVPTIERPIIRLLQPGDMAAAAAISEQAFKNEAFASRMFRLSSPKARAAFRAVLELRFLSYWAAGHPIQGLFVDQDLAAVALYKGPQGKLPILFGLRQFVVRLFRIAPLVWYLRYGTLANLLHMSEMPSAVPTPNLLLEMLGVAPRHQGQGLGSLLVQAGQQLAVTMDVRGIYLYTGDAANVRLYRRLGYSTVAQLQRGDFTVYHMFWARDASSGANGGE